MSATARARVVIVGGGFAGLSCARKLAGQPVDVVLVDRPEAEPAAAGPVSSRAGGLPHAVSGRAGQGLKTISTRITSTTSSEA